MRFKTLIASLALTLIAAAGVAQETPASLSSGYDALADSILALREAESAFVRAVLDYHYKAARRAMKTGNVERAAAEIALFGNEGDNTIGGIRKRLVEGGHHHNADDGEDGVYETGYVIVTREWKKAVLAESAALRQAGDDAARKAVWKRFDALAQKVLAAE